MYQLAFPISNEMQQVSIRAIFNDQKWTDRVRNVAQKTNQMWMILEAFHEVDLLKMSNIIPFVFFSVRKTARENFESEKLQERILSRKNCKKEF
jgi:hypothetical protein